MTNKAMGIFTMGSAAGKSKREEGAIEPTLQPTTIPFNSPAGLKPPQWSVPRDATLPANYSPPFPEQKLVQIAQAQSRPQNFTASPGYPQGYPQQVQQPQQAMSPPQQQPRYQIQPQPIQPVVHLVAEPIAAESPAAMGKPEDALQDTKPTVVATDPNAPVFIKIDKYEEILTELSDMKATINNVRNLAEVFNLVREVQLDSISILDGLMKELERSQVKLDKVLGRLEDVEERVKGSKYENVRKARPEELSDIEERIRKIREEIARLNKN